MPAEHESFALSWDDERDLSRLEWAPATVCDVAEARAVDDAIEALGRGPVRCLVNLRGIESIDRTLANFLLSLHRASTPARMCAAEADVLVQQDTQA